MEIVLAVFVCICRLMLTGQTIFAVRSLLSMSPATGDINVMIVAAVILIALFLLFVLWKGKRRDR